MDYARIFPKFSEKEKGTRAEKKRKMWCGQRRSIMKAAVWGEEGLKEESSFGADVRQTGKDAFFGQGYATFNLDFTAQAVVAVFATQIGADAESHVAEIHAWAQDATDSRSLAGLLVAEFVRELVFELRGDWSLWRKREGGGCWKTD